MIFCAITFHKTKIGYIAISKLKQGGSLGSGRPDWIAEVIVWDGSAWMYLRLGIKESIKNKIVYGFDNRGSKVGRIEDKEVLGRFACQVKRAYRNRYKGDLWWFLHSNDIHILTVNSLTEWEHQTEEAGAAILETTHGQLYYDIGSGVSA